MNNQPQRLAFLDSLRGLAALAVLLSHSFLMMPPVVATVFTIPILNMLINGKEAVAMFFVLSGFVLSRPYFLSQEPGQTPRKLYLPTFYLRRITRIWIPWLGAFVLSALVQRFLFHKWTTVSPISDIYHVYWQEPVSMRSFLRQCLFLEHDDHIQLLPQDWSLGVELKASALMPLCVLLCLTGSFWTLLVLSVLIFYFLPTGQYYVIFTLGVLLAHRGSGVVAWLRDKPISIKMCVLSLGIIFYQIHHLGMDVLLYPSGLKFYWLGTAFGCVLIILACLASRRLQNALHLPPILFLGRISYSVYLLQFIVILCVLPPWIHLLNALGIYRPVWILPLELLASVGVTVGLSAVNYYLVEEPCIKLGHALSKKWQETFLRR